MEKAKAAKILLEEYDTLSCRRMLCNKPDDIDYLNDFLIALLTAIDVLNQSSSVEAEPMDEYISKQSVIDYLNGYLHSIGEDGTYNPLFDRGQRRALINSIQDISAIKAADVQPVKHGRWIYQRDNLRLCSYCKENLIYSETETDRAEKQRYCSRCGARMDGDLE